MIYHLTQEELRKRGHFSEIRGFLLQWLWYPEQNHQNVWWGQSQAPDGHETPAEIQLGQRENHYKSTTRTHQDGMAGGLAGIHGRFQVNFMVSGRGQVSNKSFHVTKEF